MEAEFQDYEINHKWTEIFNNIRARAEGRPTRDSSRNRHLNRYLDVVPYDSTRVKIERNSLNYINASHVNVPNADRKYILTQGPLKHTSGHFWAMVWEQKTRGILMLNKIIEGGNIKCHQYWPDGTENGDCDEIVFDDVNLKVTLESSKHEREYIFRRFCVQDLNTDEQRTVFHFHYILWPDFDLPESSDSFLQYLDAVRASGCLDSEKYGPTVIHCSAGIGRSGTFVLVDSCLVMIAKNQCRDSINVIDILLEMRQCRMGLIQTPGQLRFSFQAIIEGSKRLLGDSDCESKSSLKKQNSNLKRMLGVPDDSSVSEDYDDSLENGNNNFSDNMNNNNQQEQFQLNRLSDDDDDNDNGADDENNDKDNSDNNLPIITNNIDNDDDHDEADDDDDDNNNENDSGVNRPENSHHHRCSAEEEDEKRKRDNERDERRKNIMEQINRVKRKKAEEEERLKFNQKLLKFACPVLCVGIAVCIGLYAIARKHDATSLSS